MLAIAPFLNKINRYILNPILLLLFVVALVVFFWGIFRFVTNMDGTSEREEGKRSMLYGIIGMFIMVSVFGIIRVVLRTFGIPDPPYIGGLL